MQPELQGRGIGKALIEAGVATARADRTGAFLLTGTAANVKIYGRCGFRVYDEADAPDGGPRILVHALGSVSSSQAAACASSMRSRSREVGFGGNVNPLSAPVAFGPARKAAHSPAIPSDGGRWHHGRLEKCWQTAPARKISRP